MGFDVNGIGESLQGVIGKGLNNLGNAIGNPSRGSSQAEYSYCGQCGTKLAPGIHFCPNCGAKVDDATPASSSAAKVTAQDPNRRNTSGKRRQIFDGVIHKCPNCGETLESFATRCPSCGIELRDLSSANSIQRLANQLELIESERHKDGGISVIQRIQGDKLSKTDARLVTTIKSFPIPNTKEDLLEFVVMASSNLDYHSYENESSGAQTSQRAVSDAWLAKLNQAYSKAKLSFPNDDAFREIEAIHTKATREIKRSKLHSSRGLLMAFAMLGIMFIFLFVMMAFEESRIQSRESQLETIAAQIEDDIANQKYDEARSKAYGLTFDESLSKDRAESWSKRQEQILELIDNAENGS